MRPRLPDIAAPPFLPSLRWVGATGPVAMERLTARGPVLVHFIDFAQLNSVRALPYPIAWAQRYRHAGLVVLGIHSPRFPFTADEAALRTGLERLGARHPVAADLDHAVWHDYGCEGWPSLFLWSRGGALRWFHFGEGEYEATERAIQDELALTDDARPAPIAPVRPSDAPGAVVIAPTEELLPGGSLGEPWSPGAAGSAIELDYAAGGAWATLDGAGELVVELDGERRSVAVDASGLYRLASDDHHSSHRLRIEPSPRVRVWSVSFEPGVPAPA